MTITLRSNGTFPALGIGAGSLANANGEAAFVETVQAAWSRGIRYFDTSALYLGGESEHRLGLALAGLPRSELRLSTKLGRYQDHIGSSIDPENKRSRFDFSEAATLRSVEMSLQRLHVDSLDAVFIHDLDHRLCGAAYPDLFRAARDEAYPVLHNLRKAGVIGAIGVAAMDWRACLEFSEATELDVVMPAGERTLLRNHAFPLLEHCTRAGIAWIAASPFNSGILATGARADAYYDMRPATPAVLTQVGRIEAICQRHAVPLAAVALQYPRRHASVSTVVFGAKTAAELDANLACVSYDLPEALWRDIEQLFGEKANWDDANARPD